MSKFKIGQVFDETFRTMQPNEIIQNLEGVSYDLSEESYTKNLTEEELAERKDKYSEIGVKLSDLARKQKETMAMFKAEEKEPKIEAAMLLESIKFKSEQIHGTLYLVDDQEDGMMYYFDALGVCVNARPLTRTEKQTKIKTLKNGTDE